jgi:AMMECR1 domain-containing protein/aromatic ring-opening dioxygenase LigB subunit
MSEAGIVFAGLVPHPPVVVPEVGRGREQESRDTVGAMQEFARRCMAARPEGLVLISPHSPRRPGAFGYWPGPLLQGDLSKFGAPEAGVTLPVDTQFLHDLCEAASPQALLLWPIRERELDHGALVPLYYLARAGWDGPTAVIGLNYPGEGDLEELGRLLAHVAEKQGRRYAFIASGDMSHRLQPGAPGGFHPDAHRFDAAFVDLLRQRALDQVAQMDPELTDLAGQDVIESTMIVLAATGYDPTCTEVLSYEGPFGVGYCVAVFREPVPPVHAEREGDVLTSIARQVVEAVVQGEAVPLPAVEPKGYLSQRRGMFVTLRRRDGTVRGCLGTMAPTKSNLLLEVVERAAAVAEWAYGTRVMRSELPGLLYEVTVLGSLEPVESEAELDPAVWGVVMADEHGRRAVLLPGIESVTTVEQQLSIVRRKAGISADAPVTLQKFRAEHFQESAGDASGEGEQAE